MPQKCEYPGCKPKTAQYFMGWEDEEGNKHWGMVCASHDKLLGRRNLTKYAGMDIEQILLYESYLKVSMEH